MQVGFEFYTKQEKHYFWKRVKAATAHHISHVLDITERRVQQLAKAGIIPRIGPGEYNLSEAVQAYISYIKELHKKEIENQKKRYVKRYAKLLQGRSAVLRCFRHPEG
jgi:nucleoid-associated protein YejK